jgi:hypothetical protein
MKTKTKKLPKVRLKKCDYKSMPVFQQELEFLYETLLMPPDFNSDSVIGITARREFKTFENFVEQTRLDIYKCKEKIRLLREREKEMQTNENN